ncbi:MAG: nucleotide exchange factor GrpE [Calditrichia bacterium]
MADKEKQVPVDFKEDEQQDAAVNAEKNNAEPLEDVTPETSQDLNEEHEHDEEPKAEKESSKKKKKGKEKDYHKAQQRVAELEDRLIRLQAEFVNYKKRTERQSIELGDYLKGEIIKDFLPVIDDFKHMLDNVQQQHDDVNSILEGIQMIMKKFEQVLEKFGVKKIDSLDVEFDPEVHEALITQPVPEKEKDNRVIQVYQEGYKLNDKILRPSKVIVGKYEEAGTDNETDKTKN